MKRIKSNIVIFIIATIMIFIKVMLTGGFRPLTINPISFNETFYKLPSILSCSLLIVLSSNILNRKK